MTESGQFFKNGILTLLVFISGCAVRKHVTGPEKIQPPKISYDYLWVIKPEVNIRSNPSENSHQVGTLNDGDSVRVVSNSGGWYNIRTLTDQSGWIRSDLLGPQSLSIYPKAVTFADSIKNAENVDLYFDKRLHHRRIYLTFPPSFYSDRNRVVRAAERISTSYQKTVFPGDISVILLKPGTEEIYHTFELGGLVNSDVLLPVAPFGRIIDAHFNSTTVELTYRVEEEIDEKTYIKSARDMAGAYPISYREIILKFLNKEKKCSFWYKEDSGGEIFKFGSCP